MTASNPDSILLSLTETINAGDLLNQEAITAAGNALVSESIPNEHKSRFLASWQTRGEKASEVAALAEFFRSIAKNPGLDAFANDAIDIVGTGGDKSGTFNISTVTSLIVASSGVPVIKHGNRSITSNTGSADLLEAIGIPLQTEDSILQASMEENNFVFLFAPAFHPAFKAIVPVRKALAAEGKKTVFNILGPLINPAKPKHQLMGVFHPTWVSPIAQVLETIGLKSGFVASSEYQGQPIDEITSIGSNTVQPIGRMNQTDVDELQEFLKGKSGGTLQELKGGDFKENLRILELVLKFEANPILLNTICTNTAVAFKTLGKATSISDGFEQAETLLKSGTVSKWIENTATFFRNYQ